MRNQILCSVLCVLVGGSLAWSQQAPMQSRTIPESVPPLAGSAPALPVNPPGADAPPGSPQAVPATPPEAILPPPQFDPPPPGPDGYGGPPPFVAATDPLLSPAFWVGAETLLWWVKDQPMSVPVLTTGPSAQGLSAGSLGAPGTTPISAPLDYGTFTGLRATAGAWFTPLHLVGIEGSGFFLQQRSAGYSTYDPTGLGLFVINEPLAGSPFFTQVSSPGIVTGNASVTTTTQLWGADLNALRNVYRDNGWNVNVMAGFRYLDLRESLDITSTSSYLVPINFVDGNGNTIIAAPAGSLSSSLDHFSTRNQFYGGQVGAQFQHPMGRWFISGSGKLALGITDEYIAVSGSTLVIPVGGARASLPGGVFATGTNIGKYSDNHFAIVPDVQANIGYQVGPHMRIMAGYNFIYWSSVVRPGNQLDNNSDGVTHPMVPQASSSFWAHGVNFSLQLTF